MITENKKDMKTIYKILSIMATIVSVIICCSCNNNKDVKEEISQELIAEDSNFCFGEINKQKVIFLKCQL